MKIHIVQKGDTLWKIAKKYGVNFEELKKMNSQLSNPDMIMPGMKVKVPTTGGHVKKAGHSGHNPGIKKEMQIAEHPYAKEQPKPMPIVEAPIKEAPIKEAPKAPYVPKMPTPVIPEIDINNYYMMNMANLTVQQPPPKPAVKEVPKKEVPIAPPPPPVVQAPVECPPVEQPVCEPVCEPECVPITPVMPGPGFCPPPGFPMGAPMPGAGPMPVMDPGMFPPGPGMFPPGPGMPPAVGGSAFMPPHFEDESSSAFMPHMPMMNPGAPVGAPFPQAGFPAPAPYLQPGAGFGGQVPGAGYQGYPVHEGYTAGAYPGSPEAMGGFPAGAYQGFPGGAYPQTHEGYPQGMYQGYPQTQDGYPAGAYQQGFPGTPQQAYPGYQGQFPTQQGPRNVYLNPEMAPGYGGPAVYHPYPQMPYGYPPAGPVHHGEIESSDMFPQGAAIQQPYPVQGAPFPVATGGLADCGCGAPPAAAQPFIPTTPPVYMAPYTAPAQFAQPPFMNPYGMGPMGTAPYGMPRDDDAGDENGN